MRMKTLAIRLDEEVHAQLSALASLRESTITEEIRSAIESHILNAKTSPELSTRAQTVLDEIERESEGRKAAIASLFRSSNNRSEQQEVDEHLSVSNESTEGTIGGNTDGKDDKGTGAVTAPDPKSSKSPKSRVQ
jgi:predicted transcriptional regulator